MTLNQYEQLLKEMDRDQPIICPIEYRAVTIADEFAIIRGEPIKLLLWDHNIKFSEIDELRRLRRKIHAQFLADIGELFIDGEKAVGFAPWHPDRELCLSVTQRTPVAQDVQFTETFHVTYYCRMGVT